MLFTHFNLRSFLRWQVWDFETIDNAEVTDESGLFEMEPMNELKVGNNVALKSIVKCPDEEEPTIWFAQVSADDKVPALLTYIISFTCSTLHTI